MRKVQSRILITWQVSADMAAAAAAFALAFALRFHSGLFPLEAGSAPSARSYASLLPVVLALWPLVFSVQRLYRPARVRSLLDEGFAIALAALSATIVLFGADAYFRLYLQRDAPAGQAFQYSRLFVGLFLLLDVALSVAGRALVRLHLRRLRRRGEHLRRVLIVGAGRLGARVAQRLRAHPEHGFHLLGFADDDPVKKGTRVEGVPVLGTTDDVLGLVQQERIEDLILALPWSAHETLVRILEDTSREYLDVKIVPDLLEYIAIRASLQDLDGLPLLNLGEDPLHTWDWILKRLFDMVGAALGLIVLAPLLAAIAVLVKRSSAGPVLYLQERLGLDGNRFLMVKFRTMHADAEALTGPTFAADLDPRCTAAGRWLRRLSLDELPQLWNVLRGDMSIVGPRPERPSFVSEFKHHIPRYMLRHKMKSGITGWAQVNGWRGNTSIHKRLEHDLHYVTNWSLALDVKIVLLTLLHGWR